MKAHPSKLPPELEKLTAEKALEAVRLERGAIALQMLQLSLHTLACPPYNWGRKRLEDFWSRQIKVFEHLTAVYGDDCWADKILADLRRVGVEFEDDGWMQDLIRLHRQAEG